MTDKKPTLEYAPRARNRRTRWHGAVIVVLCSVAMTFAAKRAVDRWRLQMEYEQQAREANDALVRSLERSSSATAPSPLPRPRRAKVPTRYHESARHVAGESGKFDNGG